MKDLKLRAYQKEFVSNIINAFGSHKRVIGVAPCGSGKTRMATEIVQEFSNKKILFFVHRHELIEQTSKTFTAAGIKHGIIEAGRSDNQFTGEKVQIASIQTLTRRMSKIAKPDLLICDECHHILAKSYLTILKQFSSAKLLGLTATPERYGGVRLGDIFTSMVQAPTVQELIDMGYLSKFEYYAPSSDIDLSKVKVVAGEYKTADLEGIMINERITGGIFEHYNKIMPNQPAICYCVNRKHSEFVANWFRENGVPAVHLDCQTPKSERDQIVNDFRKGLIKILCNVNLFDEGFDSPGMSGVILARPTKSLTKHIQQSMRALRVDPNNPNKVAYILDHVSNFKRFGLPTTIHEWSLDPNEEKPDPVKQCPNCGLVVPADLKQCPGCGLVFKRKKPATDNDDGNNFLSTDGELKQVTEQTPSTKTEVKKNFDAPRGIERLLEIAKERNYAVSWAALNALVDARSLEECQAIAKACGYKSGWAFYKWRALEQLLKENKDPRLYRRSLLNS